MQRISLAPVLSATLSRDSCWIIGFSPGCRAGSRPLQGERALPNWCWLLLGLLEHGHDAPALRGRQRTGLHDLDPVADAALVGLVVGLQLHGPAHDLAVERVLHAVLDGHDDGLVHLVAHHEALTDLATGTVCGHFTHAAPSLAAPGAVRMPSS